MAASVDLSCEGPVAWITISNIEKHNAMSLQMWRDLDAALIKVPDESRCIVVRGAGEKAFVSGADISEFAGQRRSPEDVTAYDAYADGAMAHLYDAPQPTIAMISGYCFGGGVALALCCDIRLAAETAEFSVPAARLGLGYGPDGLKKLLDVVSAPVAMDIMFSARRFTAAEALGARLINRTFAAAALEAETRAYAGIIAGNAPLTIRAAKRSIRELTKSSAADLEYCRALTAQCFNSDDYLEGARAFMEKRRPRFKGS